MTSTTSGFENSTTSYFDGDSDYIDRDQWSEVPLYYDPGFQDFCLGKLRDLEQLKPNWDREGAPPIHRETIAAVREFIKSLPAHIATRPMIVPLSSGQLQLEWHNAKQTLEIEFTSPSEVHYLKWDPERQIDDEDVMPASSRYELERMIRWFMQGLLSA